MLAAVNAENLKTFFISVISVSKYVSVVALNSELLAIPKKILNSSEALKRDKSVAQMLVMRFQDHEINNIYIHTSTYLQKTRYICIISKYLLNSLYVPTVKQTCR